MTIKDLKNIISELCSSEVEFTLNYLNENKEITSTHTKCKINVLKKTKFSIALNSDAVIYIDYDSENNWILHENNFTKLMNKGYIQILLN